MKAFHVMHITDTLAPGGKERILVDLANAQHEHGACVSVCVTRDDTTLAAELKSEIPCFQLGRKKRFDFKALRDFSKLVNEKKVSLLHAHGRSTFSFLAFAKTFGFIKTPILFHDHYGSIEIDSSIPLWFRLWAKSYVDLYVGVYDKLADWALRAGVCKEKVKVFGNTLNLKRFERVKPIDLHEEFSLPKEALLGIGVGNLRNDKGWHVLIEAFSKVATRDQMRFLIVGGANDLDYQKRCQKQCEALGLSQYILFLGKRQDVPNLLKSADFAFIPSLSESGPLVLIEMMASKLPYIATQVGDIAQRVSKLEPSFFINPNHVDEAIQKLEQVSQMSASEREARGAQGLQIVQEHFDIEKSISAWQDAYLLATQKTK